MNQILGFGILFFWPLTSFAYLDPGTGSIILQVVFGGIAGAIIIIKIYWSRLKSFFTKMLKR